MSTLPDCRAMFFLVPVQSGGLPPFTFARVGPSVAGNRSTFSKELAMAQCVKGCDCLHRVQDRLYGLGQRLHNGTGVKRTAQGDKWRCTVCGRVKG